MKGLHEGSYKFTVKAYTSAGEETGATVSISLELYSRFLFNFVIVKSCIYFLTSESSKFLQIIFQVTRNAQSLTEQSTVKEHIQ